MANEPSVEELAEAENRFLAEAKVQVLKRIINIAAKGGHGGVLELAEAYAILHTRQPSGRIAASKP
ncbi:hypothetical protein [Actinoplanes sp. NPDC026619]|uniref:hypothetical protein n=1 Tax=Actinoplanes sp. NPDC026619 TaxID=3155798 RepID=UPI0033D957DC